jgi:hypothetical protein
VTCQFCNRKAILNMRLLNGKPTLEGAQVEIGAEREIRSRVLSVLLGPAAYSVLIAGCILPNTPYSGRFSFYRPPRAAP